ncbi:PAS domain S-box-containing protein [Scopulibacillus darangshiensis]|uniref:HTH-type transcriptional regulatory protein TyrR n=1 Tax=Scopulibacillus darangshiensis TaxID=442528 RepID=A0A4V2SM15_9BACL|nr:sigma 54-interacting transcriptional regulator [Scopulibacillus darangshiensis]TCP25606.1 PAS domain S-box-containing protein [Scopulibacillus darangshiensis]
MRHTEQWLENIPLPVVVTNHDGVIRRYNFRFAQLFAKKADGINIQELFDQWTSYEHNIISAQLEGKPYALNCNECEDDGQASLFYVVNDGAYIQKVQQKIHELSQVNQELDAIIEDSFDVIYITDGEGNTLKVNSAIETCTGFSKENFIEKNVRTLVKDGYLKDSVTLKVLEQKQTVTILTVNNAGKERLSTGKPIFNEEGEIVRVVTNARNFSELDEVYQELRKALELNNYYKKELEKLKSKNRRDPDAIIKSADMLEIFDLGERISEVDATVLVLGETGVGKDVLAKHIHRSGRRYENGKFVKINCGAIPHDLLESELFGYEAGAFTGAKRTGKQGMFELANNGTLFLDEVGDLPLTLQVKLLRVLQEKSIQRVGGTKMIDVDVRLIAATNRNLKQMVKEGEFREDLFYRLNVIPIHIPPLRERKEDILPLVYHFLHTLNTKYLMKKEFDRGLKEFFYNYNWPGNVRELSNLVERLILMATEDVVTVKHLPAEYGQQEYSEQEYGQPIHDQKEYDLKGEYEKEMTLKEAKEIAERKVLIAAVQRYGSTYEIAHKLRTSQTTIVRKLKQYKLHANQ